MSASQERTTIKTLTRRSWRFWFGTILSLAALIWLIVTTDWAEVWEALVQANYLLVLAATLLNVLTIPMRSHRWRMMFPRATRPPFGQLTAIMLIGQAVNLFVPARFGDLVRASLLESHHVAYTMGTQLLRLVLDLMMLSGLVLVLLFRVRLPDWVRGPGELMLITTALVLLGLATLVVFRGYASRFIDWLDRRWPWRRGRQLLEVASEFLSSLALFANPGLMVGLLAWTAIIWLFYASVNYVLLAAVGVSPSWLAAVFVLVVLLVGVAVPTSPGRVGVYHFLAVQALAVFDVPQATAVSFAILLHLITFILPAALAALLAWQLGITLKSLSGQAEG